MVLLPAGDSHANRRGDGRPLSFPPATARAFESLVFRRRAGVRDGGRRRHHPPHRKRAVDHRVEADFRRRPAAQPWRLAARLRPLPRDAPISRGRRPGGNDARRVQVHLLVGMGASAAGTDHRDRVPASGAVVRRQAGDPQRLWLAPRRPVRARRRAGRDRLVHGDVGARGPHRSEPVSPLRASVDGVVPDERADLDRARSAPPAMRARRG